MRDPSAMTGGTELYRPRSVVQLGNMTAGHLDLKVYGIAAAGKELTQAMVDDARLFVTEALPRLALNQGEHNGLGFVIIHPGDFGISILGHWWIQGSVLCQHIRRTLWGSATPMDTADRTVIACVWELELIHAEQQIWQATMMSTRPDAQSYLKARAAAATV